MLGHIQQAIVELGRQKGYVDVNDITCFYPSQVIRREMSKLIVLGYFRQEMKNGNVIWVYNDKRM